MILICADQAEQRTSPTGGCIVPARSYTAHVLTLLGEPYLLEINMKRDKPTSKLKFGQEKSPQPGACSDCGKPGATNKIPRKRYSERVLGDELLCDDCFKKRQAKGK